MSQDKQYALNKSITANKFSGCFVTSFCSNYRDTKKMTTDSQDNLETLQPEGQINQEPPSKPRATNQGDLPRCKMLILGNLTEHSQQKESYLSSITWKIIPGNHAPKFYSEKKSDYHLTIHDISECDKNSYELVLKKSTYIVLIPNSAKDLSLCCHAVFDKDTLLSKESKVVYLNLADPNSQEYLAIEKIAKNWIEKGYNLSSVNSPSIRVLIKEAVEHTMSIHQQLSVNSHNETNGNQGCFQKV